MIYNKNNIVVKLCAKGMMLEGKGENKKAFEYFQKAWELATNNLEKSTSAHYVARHQNNLRKKLEWDLRSVKYALKVKEPGIKSTLPSLYLNIGKCYEDLGDFINAKKYYLLAKSNVRFLDGDGYGRMITQGIASGVERVS